MAKKHNNALFKDKAVEVENSELAADINESAANDITMTTNLQQENLKLVQANQELTEKISEYLDEIKDLRTKVEQLQNLDKPNTLAVDNIVKELQQENDNYLVKISDLTFENAKLQAQLNELSKTIDNSNDNLDQSSKKANVTQSIKVPYYNSYKNNGYNDWN